MTEQTLSDKIQDEFGDRCLKLEDVKDFIKKLKEEIEWCQTRNNPQIGIITMEIIDKLAGEKLI
jgi:hypothetical protein